MGIHALKIIGLLFFTKKISSFRFGKRDTMGERIKQIGQIETDFFASNARILSKKSKKIRFNLPNPLNPFSHCIPFLQSGNCCKKMKHNMAEQKVDFLCKKIKKKIVSQKRTIFAQIFRNKVLAFEII